MCSYWKRISKYEIYSSIQMQIAQNVRLGIISLLRWNIVPHLVEKFSFLLLFVRNQMATYVFRILFTFDLIFR